MAAAWSIVAAAEQGPVRSSMQDRHVVLPECRFLGRRSDVVAVFDGAGGIPHGGEAAQAAAAGLAQAIRDARRPEDVLGTLQQHVLRTGGATTAVVCALPHDSGEAMVLWSGDSSAYLLGDEVQAITVPDGEMGYLTRALGLPGLIPHSVPVSVPLGGGLLLCSDGIDGVVGMAGLREAATGARNDADFVERLLASVRAQGFPDNATAILARRIA